jgi:hypothetical protein
LGADDERRLNDLPQSRIGHHREIVVEPGTRLEEAVDDETKQRVEEKEQYENKAGSDEDERQ